MENTFELTESHIKLLRAMYVDFCDDGYDGAPAVNLKRPYGNSDVISDVIEIVTGVRVDDLDDVPEENINEALKLHEETGTALQIILCTGSFTPGTYKRASKYDARSWELV